MPRPGGRGVRVAGWRPILCTAALAAPAFAETPIVVQLDRARLIKLPEQATTVVIGDPLIADVAIQPNGLAVITGKGYGATNVIVLDNNGAVLNEQTVEVKGPADPTVVVYRGTYRETYSCTPDCSRRMTLGDDPDYFDKTLDQISTRNSQAMAAGSPPSWRRRARRLHAGQRSGDTRRPGRRRHHHHDRRRAAAIQPTGTERATRAQSTSLALALDGYGIGSAVVDLIFSMAKREVTFFSGTAAISPL